MTEVYRTAPFEISAGSHEQLEVEALITARSLLGCEPETLSLSIRQEESEIPLYTARVVASA